MAKKKDITQGDLKKFFEKAKKKLDSLGKETKVWMKKGEVELSRLSKIGKLELDVVNLNMKKERLFKDIGKRVVERGLDKEIKDLPIKNMCTKANAAAAESKRKKRAMSKIGKGLLKGSPAKAKGKK